MRPKPRLLVIDDDAAVREVVMALGSAAGFDVAGCDDGVTLEDCLREPVDLIILDLVMPVMDGVEVIERLAQEHSAARLVLVSGQDRRVVASASRLATAHGLKVAASFTKPFDSVQLRSCFVDEKAAIASGDTARLRRLPPQIRLARVEQALPAREIVLHYQPQVSLDTLEWVGVESLVRWEHPEYGLLPPDTFVPLLEREPPLMHRLSEYLLRRACRDMSQPEVARAFSGRVGLNVPADVLAAADFPERLVALAAEAGFDHERLVLEVTETTLPAEPVKVLAIQTRLRMRGVSLAVDDFGTGHSSLERLHTFPMDELKIDLSFVRESTSDPEARAIVQNSVALARDLRVRCVAEGVEDVAALSLLAELRCECAQGYFIGRPMPASELAAWAERWRDRRESLRAMLA